MLCGNQKSRLVIGIWSHTIIGIRGRDVALSKNLSDLKRCRTKIRICELFLRINDASQRILLANGNIGVNARLDFASGTNLETAGIRKPERASSGGEG